MLQTHSSYSLAKVSALCLLILLILLVSRTLYNDRASPAGAEHYQSLARERISIECKELSGPPRAKCEAEIADAELDNHRADQDLFIQKDMAGLALAMLAISGFALAATITGIVYVKQTLGQAIAVNDAAHAAIAVTQQIGQAQVRPYIGIKSITPKLDQDAIMVNVSLSNFGQSYALNVVANITWRASAGSFKDSWLTSFKEDEAIGIVSPSQTVSTRISTNRHECSEALSPQDIERVKSGELRLWIFGSIRYNDAFEVSHTTSFRFVSSISSQVVEFVYCSEGNDAS